MKNENIILFIPIDTSNLDNLPNFQNFQPNIVIKEPKIINPKKYNPDIFKIKKNKKIKNKEDEKKDEEDDEDEDEDEDIPGFDLLNKKSDMNIPRYNEEVFVDDSLTHLNLIYDPIIDDKNDPFQFKENDIQNNELDYSNIFIQFKECNKRMEWPIFTEIHCKQDSHPFNNRPWYLPC